MFSSFTVGAVFTIVNEASPTLRLILAEVRKLNLQLDQARASLTSLGKLAMPAARSQIRAEKGWYRAVLSKLGMPLTKYSRLCCACSQDGCEIASRKRQRRSLSPDPNLDWLNACRYRAKDQPRSCGCIYRISVIACSVAQSVADAFCRAAGIRQRPVRNNASSGFPLARRAPQREPARRAVSAYQRGTP
jgi:hypothetical protein